MVRGFFHRWRLQWSEYKPWMAGALLAFSIHWAAIGIKESLEAWLEGKHVATGVHVANVVYIALFALAIRWLFSLRKTLFRPRTRFLKNEPPEKREYLVLFLSNLNLDISPNGIPSDVTLSGDLDKDLKMLVTWKQQTRQRWPWEMPLRSIAHHLGKLKTVAILCSPESVQQVHWFGRVLAHYSVLHDLSIKVFVHHANAMPALIDCPVELLKEEGGWEFEQFDQLSSAVMYLLDEFQTQHVSDNQIMIDFTDGQKVTSVVATSVTFNRTIKAQYVQTNEPHAVISYDILLGSAETPGLHH